MREIVKFMVGGANRPIAQARLRRALAVVTKPYKIEIGAHRTGHPGWIGTDISWRTRYYMDATKPWPVPDDSASHVYADNMIEHIRMEPNRIMFREARRALAPGGKIRLATPDVEYAVELYVKNNEETREAIDRSAWEAHHPVDLLRIPFQECGHHRGYLWDFQSLSSELEAAGFTGVRRYDPGHSDDPNFRNLESRKSWALIVEAEVD
ncbi:methyltransferase domain-containing protein [Streptomyces sp. RB6PN25]|uniref:Methyltransferase domain-containing protein n=1 Tax=Streptomyces humicola TaxID=2953240 RepID=A0ABT1PPU4_9ACTN|nr:methyltransferase domain-containing protein [Streptomyces humicola]MCQ4079689.1 methyltransferase domain-containing protein [Streptomyces humicola]